MITEKANPMRDIINRRVSAPLPEILFEDECRRLLAASSADSRTYLLIFLFLETGIKLKEMFALKESHFDFSNCYGPEVHIKHSWKKEKKSRILNLTMEITTAFNYCVSRYKVHDLLLQYTHRFVQLIITQTEEKAGIKKRLYAQILQDTCAVRQLKQGERIEQVLEWLGLSETTWEDAKGKYLKLAKGGI